VSDYYLALEPIIMQTADGGVVQPQSEVSASEQVTCAVSVMNPAPEASGQLTVSWSLDGIEVWAEMDIGISGLETKVLQWHDQLPIPEGDHIIGVHITPFDPQAVNEGTPQEIQFKVIPQVASAGEAATPSGSGYPVVVKDAAGNVVYQGHAEAVTLQGALESWGMIERELIEDGLAAISFPLDELKALANELGATLAGGIQASAAAVLGVEAGAGVYLGPNGETGWYHSLGADLGAVLGASVEAIVAGVKGGPNVFAGQFFSVTASGGELAVGGATALFSVDSGAFVGIAVHGGIGAGFPVNVFATWSNTWLHSF
jgi:hypothetical protein